MTRPTIIAFAGAVLAASVSSAVLAASPSSIWDGVYAKMQAARGEVAYTQNCARCHGDDLEGGDEVTTLGGSHFMVDFDGGTLADLVHRIQTTMPMETPGKLGLATVTDITAFLLRQNGVPAGNAELPADPSAQSLIRFDAVKK